MHRYLARVFDLLIDLQHEKSSSMASLDRSIAAARQAHWWVRAYFAMGMAMVVQSCFTLAKTVRDVHEANRMINRIEEARTERLLSAERT